MYVWGWQEQSSCRLKQLVRALQALMQPVGMGLKPVHVPYKLQGGGAFVHNSCCRLCDT